MLERENFIFREENWQNLYIELRTIFDLRVNFCYSFGVKKKSIKDQIGIWDRFSIIATVTFSLFPGLKTSFYESWNRWTTNIVIYSLVTFASSFVSSLFAISRLFCAVLFNSYFRVWTVSLLSLPVMPYTRISSNSIVQSGIWRFSILRFHRSLHAI